MAKKLHLVHAKSNVLDKAPSASTLNYGEIAVNYNSESPAIYIRDDEDNIVKFISEYYFNKIVGTGVTETSGETFIPLSEIIQEDELAIAAALNDLHSDVVDLDARKIEFLTVTGSGNVVSTIEKDGTGLFVTLTEAGDSFIVDSALTSSSTNAVENRAIYDAIVKDEKVTAAAINDLNDRKADLLDVTQLFTELEGDIDDMWDRISDIEGLPAVTAADNGKTLKVVDGVWTLVDPVTVYSGTQAPPTTLGANGDVYLQTS